MNATHDRPWAGARAPRCLAAGWLLALAAAGAPPAAPAGPPPGAADLAQQPAPVGTLPVDLEWPEDCDARDVFAGSGAPLPAGALIEPANWPPHEDPEAWLDPGAWSRWAESLARSEPSARAAAVRAALAQGRHDSAWQGLVEIAGQDPAEGARLLPAFLPGLTAPARVDVRGKLEALPDGVLLAPALPPPTRTPGRFDIRSATVNDLAIGSGRARLTVGVRGDGIEYELEHIGGDAIELRLLVTAPLGRWIENLYADWDKQADMRAPISIRLEPGAEPYRVWARTRAQTLAWPGIGPDVLDPRMERTGIEFVVGRSDPWRAEIEDLARGMERMLGVRTRVADEPRIADGLSPVRLVLPGPDRRESWLLELVEATERFARRDPRLLPADRTR